MFCHHLDLTGCDIYFSAQVLLLVVEMKDRGVVECSSVEIPDFRQIFKKNYG